MPNQADILKGLVGDVIVQVALGLLAKTWPFFALPIINPIAGIVIGIVAGFLFDAGKLLVDLKVIEFKEEKFKRAFDDASVKLYIIAKNKGIDSPEFKEARIERKKTLSDLVQFHVAP